MNRYALNIKTTFNIFKRIKTGTGAAGNKFFKIIYCINHSY